MDQNYYMREILKRGDFGNALTHVFYAMGDRLPRLVRRASAKCGPRLTYMIGASVTSGRPSPEVWILSDGGSTLLQVQDLLESLGPNGGGFTQEERSWAEHLLAEAMSFRSELYNAEKKEEDK